MNGFELERILSMIDVNVKANRPRLRAEVIRFIQNHEDEVLAQLRAKSEASVPTSLGIVTLRLADVMKAVEAVA